MKSSKKDYNDIEPITLNKTYCVNVDSKLSWWELWTLKIGNSHFDWEFRMEGSGYAGYLALTTVKNTRTNTEFSLRRNSKQR